MQAHFRWFQQPSQRTNMIASPFVFQAGGKTPLRLLIGRRGFKTHKKSKERGRSHSSHVSHGTAYLLILQDPSTRDIVGHYGDFGRLDEAMQAAENLVQNGVLVLKDGPHV